jgi:DNA-binding MarR family transcriptional regulator
MSATLVEPAPSAGIEGGGRMSAQEYFVALVRHETDLWNAVERRMRGDGVVSLARLEVLRVIAAAPEGARVQDVATGVGGSIAAASRLLDRLDADGLLVRAPDPTDRRSVRSRLSPAGEAALAAADARFTETLDAVLVHADAAAISAGVAALERMQHALEAGR